jgi:uncharacterized protein DUF2865
MNSSSERPRLASLGIGIAAYVVGTAFAAVVTAHAVWRVATVVVHQLDTPVDTARNRDVATVTPAARVAVAAPAIVLQSVRRVAAMTPLAERATDRWDGRWGGAYGRPQPRGWGATSAQLATSTRNAYRPFGAQPVDSDDDDDEESRPAGTYRTVCVRLCDGYYFPISFVVTADRLERDREVCESRCGAQGRLFVHRNPGGTTDDMQDLAGRPYRQLRTAFLYRTEYVPSCKCQPDPWEAASRDRHRVYALTASVKKGDKDAAKELQTLQTKVKEAAKLAGQPALLSPTGPGEGAPPGMTATGSAKAAEIARREDGTFMGLGGNGAPKAKAESKSDGPPLTSRSDMDWTQRIFGR